MKKHFLSLVFFLFILILTGAIKDKAICSGQDTTNTHNSNQRMDANTFAEKLYKAIESNDRAMIMELVKEIGPSHVYAIIKEFVSLGLESIAKGGSGQLCFRPAEELAICYSIQFGKEGLLEKVKQYKLYDQEMHRQMLQGHKLWSEGKSLFEIDRFNEALSKYNDALRIFDKLNDSASIAGVLLYKGEMYLSQSQYTKSLDCLEQSLKISRQFCVIETEYNALSAIGDVYLHLNQLGDSLEYYEQSLDLFQYTENIADKATSISRIANIYVQLEQYPEAIEYYNEAINLGQQDQDFAAVSQILRVIADLYKKLDQLTIALNYYKQSLEISRKLKDKSTEFNNIMDIAVIYNDLNQYNEALNYYILALDLSRRLSSKANEFIILGNIGNILDQLGQTVEALDYYNQALTYCREIGDEKNEAIVLMNIGKSYTNRSKYSEALSYYHKALNIGRRINDKNTKAIALGKIAFVFLELTENYKPTDFDRINEYIKQTGPVVLFEIITSYASDGIKKVANRKDGSTNFNNADRIALIYAKAFNKDELVALVKRYRAFNREMCNEYCRGHSLINKGWEHYQNDQLNEALSKWNDALKIFDSLDDSASKINALTNIGVIYAIRKKYTKSLDYFKQALEISKIIGEISLGTGAMGNIGGIHFELGRFKEAINYYKQALELNRQIGDVASEFNTLLNISAIYESLNQYRKAFEYSEQILDIENRTEDVTINAETYTKIGDIRYHLGRYTEAVSYFQKALEIDRKERNEAGEAIRLSRLGNIYQGLYQYTEALNYYQKARDISKKIQNKYIEAQVLSSIGNNYGSQGQYTNALNYLNKALKLTRETKGVVTEANILTNIGIIYKKLGLYTKALDYYEKALEIDERIGDLTKKAKDYGNIGWLYIELGQYDKGIAYVQESLKISKQLGEIETVWKAQSMLGRAYMRTGKGVEAVEFFDRAINNIEEIYYSTAGLKEEERSSMIMGKSFVYYDFFELLLELHGKFPDKGYDKQAFTLSEKAKSRVFQELMTKAEVKTIFTGNASFQKTVEKEQQLNTEISYLRGRLFQELSISEKEKDEEVLQSLKDQLASDENALRELQREINSKYPRYADLKIPKSLSIAETQKILHPHEILLSYYLGVGKSAVFIIGKTVFKLIELEVGMSEITELISMFRKGLNDIDDILELEKFDPKVSYELYRKIFYPISKELRGIERLFITADGLLYTLPFEALIDEPVDLKTFENRRKLGKNGQKSFLGEYAILSYLVDEYTITYLPSVSVLRSLRQNKKPGYGQWTKPIIAFADPIFSPEQIEQADEQEIKEKGIQVKGISKETALTTQIITRSTGSNRLKRLEASAEEAKAIAKEVKGKIKDIYLREQATEENVHQAELKAARYLLFSTHGLLGGEFIGGVAEPALALTLVGNPPGRDGFLTMSEVLGLNLNAEVVILSACNTYGRGEMAGSGEGFAGLARSFMYAGAQSLLVTHWSVESRAARDLMVEVFRARKGGSRLDEALREAKLQMRKSTFAPIKDIPDWKVSRSHPYFWAPFVVVGEAK